MKGILTLENGMEFIGKWLGNVQQLKGELIYFTGMGRFQEFATDPANQGKIVVATFPGILNSDMNGETYESDRIQIAGLISQQEMDGEHQDKQSLLEIFTAQGIPVLAGVNTREIIRLIKQDGECSAFMKPDTETKSHSKDHSSSQKQQVKELSPAGDLHVVVVNFGYKKSLIDHLAKAGFRVTAVSPSIGFDKVKSLQPDGIIFSGGGGSPEAFGKQNASFKKVASSWPTIGIGLGHQILALAFGGKVGKMQTGHRSFKEAVIEAESGKVLMSAQNHEWIVLPEGLKESGLSVSFRNVRDQSIEGLTHHRLPISTYQFHPEPWKTPLNEIIIQSFITSIKEHKGASVYA